MFTVIRLYGFGLVYFRLHVKHGLLNPPIADQGLVLVKVHPQYAVEQALAILTNSIEVSLNKQQVEMLVKSNLIGIKLFLLLCRVRLLDLNWELLDMLPLRL